MPTWTGSFNSSGSPVIKFKLGGPIPGSEQEFEGIIDTGFTGFVSMPIVSAFPLGLLLAGTTAVTLADGKSAPLLTATGAISIESESQIGVVLLQGGSADILLGMDFLRKFERVLFVHAVRNIVSMVDCATFDKLMDLSTMDPAAAYDHLKNEAAKDAGTTSS